MKITVINGTPVKGITYHYKEMFLSHFDKDTIIEQFYPSDIPPFCLGCKNCFFNGFDKCPHYNYTSKIWESIKECDLIVFAYPSYAFQAPASIKSLLDHLCVFWMVHRPEKLLFNKKAVILTNSVGMAFQQKRAIQTVKYALSWMGVSYIYSKPCGMMGDIIYSNIKDESLKLLENNSYKLYKKVIKKKNTNKMKLSVRFKFFACKKLHYATLKGDDKISLDNQHYIDNGWIKL